VFIERVKLLVLCVCGPLFVTCCYWCVATTDNMPATQTEDLWSETKPSVQIHQQKNYIHIPSCSTLFETPISPAHCWTLTDILFGIIQQLHNCVQAS